MKPNFPVGKDETGATVTADPISAINFRSVLQGKDPYRELRGPRASPPGTCMLPACCLLSGGGCLGWVVRM